MGLEHIVTVFPRDPAHRLVGRDLELFCDRLAERLVAFGEGARAELRAGRYQAHASTVPALVEALNAARAAGAGRQDLHLRLRGEARDPFSRFLGAFRVDLRLDCLVAPQPLVGASRCGSCGWPRDDAPRRNGPGCARPSCGPSEAAVGAARAARARASAASATAEAPFVSCWRLSLIGEGPQGIGERFVHEGRRLERSPFFEALEGAARTRLLEWHTWCS